MIRRDIAAVRDGVVIRLILNEDTEEAISKRIESRIDWLHARGYRVLAIGSGGQIDAAQDDYEHRCSGHRYGAGKWLCSACREQSQTRLERELRASLAVLRVQKRDPLALVRGGMEKGQ